MRHGLGREIGEDCVSYSIYQDAKLSGHIKYRISYNEDPSSQRVDMMEFEKYESEGPLAYMLEEIDP